LRYGQKTSARRAVEKGALAATLGACGLVFQATFEAAHFTIAQQPLAFTISRLLHGRTTGVAAIARWGARRVPHGFVTAGAIAKNCGMFFAA
jgi:hypothetical protein